jgi:hypothetical protein
MTSGYGMSTTSRSKHEKKAPRSGSKRGPVRAMAAPVGTGSVVGASRPVCPGGNRLSRLFANCTLVSGWRRVLQALTFYASRDKLAVGLEIEWRTSIAPQCASQGGGEL